MNELNNLVIAVGNYNSVPTFLTSNTSVVNMTEGLTITKTANKTNWIDGVKASSSQYNYNETTHTLTINPSSITVSSSSTLKFQVTKKV